MSEAEIKKAINAITEAPAAFGLPGFGAPVTKIGTGYSGPGVIRGIAIAEDGSPRVVVGHCIEGGSGSLMHIYTPGLIEWRKANDLDFFGSKSR